MTPTQLLAASLARIHELEKEAAEKQSIYEAAIDALKRMDKAIQMPGLRVQTDNIPAEIEFGTACTMMDAAIAAASGLNNVCK